jgi:hypothetical protein
MKVRFIPPSPNAFKQHRPNLPVGVDHIDNVTGKTLIKAGLAEEIPLAPRGSASWLAERKEIELAAQTAPAPAVVQWSVTRSVRAQCFAITAKCSRENCASFYFDGDPHALTSAPTTPNVLGRGGRSAAPFFASIPGRYMAIEHLQFVHSCGGGAPENVPEAIAEQYRKQYRPAAVTPDLAEYYHNATGEFGRRHDKEMNGHLGIKPGRWGHGN